VKGSEGKDVRGGERLGRARNRKKPPRAWRHPKKRRAFPAPGLSGGLKNGNVAAFPIKRHQVG